MGGLPQYFTGHGKFGRGHKKDGGPETKEGGKKNHAEPLGQYREK